MSSPTVSRRNLLGGLAQAILGPGPGAPDSLESTPVPEDSAESSDALRDDRPGLQWEAELVDDLVPRLLSANSVSARAGWVLEHRKALDEAHSHPPGPARSGAVDRANALAARHLSLHSRVMGLLAEYPRLFSSTDTVVVRRPRAQQASVEFAPDSGPPGAGTAGGGTLILETPPACWLFPGELEAHLGPGLAELDTLLTQGRPTTGPAAAPRGIDPAGAAYRPGSCPLCKMPASDVTAVEPNTEEALASLIREDLPEWEPSTGTCGRCRQLYLSLLPGGLFRKPGSTGEGCSRTSPASLSSVDPVPGEAGARRYP